MARIGDVGPYAEFNVECITNAENCSRRRRLRGSEHPMARLTIQQVQSIYCSTESKAILAARYGIDEGHVYKIKARLTWGHVTAHLPPAQHDGYATGERQGSAKLTRRQARRIFLSDGLQKEIAERSGISESTVGAIKARKNWRADTADL